MREFLRESWAYVLALVLYGISFALMLSGIALTWSLYALLSLPLLCRYSTLSVAAYSVLLGGLATVVFAAPQLIGTDWSAVGSGAWAGAAYSTVLASASAFAAWQKGVSRMGAGRMLAYLYLVTLVGVLSSVLLLGDTLGPLKLFGSVAILVGIYLARRR